jgi:hypothetical protein
MRKTVKFASIYGNDGVLRRQENGREGKNTEYMQLNGSLVARDPGGRSNDACTDCSIVQQ